MKKSCLRAHRMTLLHEYNIKQYYEWNISGDSPYIVWLSFNVLVKPFLLSSIFPYCQAILLLLPRCFLLLNLPLRRCFSLFFISLISLYFTPFDISFYAHCFVTHSSEFPISFSFSLTLLFLMIRAETNIKILIVSAITRQ